MNKAVNFDIMRDAEKDAIVVTQKNIFADNTETFETLRLLFAGIEDIKGVNSNLIINLKFELTANQKREIFFANFSMYNSITINGEALVRSSLGLV